MQSYLAALTSQDMGGGPLEQPCGTRHWDIGSRSLGSFGVEWSFEPSRECSIGSGSRECGGQVKALGSLSSSSSYSWMVFVVWQGTISSWGGGLGAVGRAVAMKGGITLFRWVTSTCVPESVSLWQYDDCFSLYLSVDLMLSRQNVKVLKQNITKVKNGTFCWTAQLTKVTASVNSC